MRLFLLLWLLLGAAAPAGVDTTLRQPAGPSRGPSSTDAPSSLARAVPAPAVVAPPASRVNVVCSPAVPAEPKNSAYSDHPNAASTPTEISVSMVAAA